MIIPAFNEEARIGKSLESIISFLQFQPNTWEVIVLDDSSRDGAKNGNDVNRKVLAVRFYPLL